MEEIFIELNMINSLSTTNNRIDLKKDENIAEENQQMTKSTKGSLQKKKNCIFSELFRKGGEGVYPNPNFKNISNLEL